MFEITIKQLLEAGVHFGHPTKKWNPKMAEYIFTQRNGIHIVDLQKTVKKFEESYNYVSELAQEGGYAWTVVDQKMMDASSTYNGYYTKGFAVKGETVEELAAAMGTDAAVLAETLNTWNAAVAAQKDEEFGRMSFANPLDTAPYYAVMVAPGIHHTMGGVEINTETQVLTAEGTAIPGLFAAGEVTGGVHGANRLGGNAVSDFVVFGRIAGEEAVKLALEN